MSTEGIHVCLDKILTPEERSRANKAAIAENGLNAGVASGGQGASAPTGNMGLAAPVGSMWQPGRTIRVRFLNGDAAVQQKIVQYAKEWLNYADLNLSFGADPQAEVRIDISADGQSWSQVGTDCLGVAAGAATMHYGWLTPSTADDEYSRVVIHEFGHALGCIHEHQNPAGNIQWNKDAVYRYYEGPPNNWTKDQVDGNLFQKYASNTTQFSAVDPSSIMMYPIDKAFTTNGFSVGWNRVLSPMDKAFIRRWYPPFQVRINMTAAQYQQTFNDFVNRGFFVRCISGYNVGGQDRYAATFTKTPLMPGMTAWEAHHGMTGAQYQQTFNNLVGKGFRLFDVSGYQVGSEAHYAAVWVKAPSPAWEAHHGMTADQYQQTFNNLAGKGMRLVHVNGYSVNGQAFYAAIWEKNSGIAFVARHGMTADQYQTCFTQFTAQGYRLADVCGYAVGNQTLYAAIWNKVAGVGYNARHGLSNATFTDTNKQYQLQGFEPARVSGYTVNGQDTYAGIWEGLL